MRIYLLVMMLPIFFSACSDKNKDPLYLDASQPVEKRVTIQGLKNGIIPMIGSLIEVLMRICAPVILSSIIGYISICVAGPAAWTASMLLMLAVYYIKMKGFKNKKALA